MQRAGLAVTLLTDDAPSDTARQELTRRQIAIHVAPPNRRPIARRIQQHALRLTAPRSAELARRLHAEHPTLVQFEGVDAPSHAPGLSRAGAPLVYSSHNFETRLAAQRAAGMPARSGAGLQARYHAHRVQRMESRVAQAAAAVVCVSEADADDYRSFGARVVIAPNGVDAGFFAVGPPAQDNEDVLFFGQFTYAPNLSGLRRFLRDGWPILASARPRARLLIAGEGSTELLHDSGHDRTRVRVLGLVDDIVATVARSQLTLVPIWDGGGTRLKVLESLAAMRPVIGTELGVAGIGFVSGRHGVTAATPEDLAQATVSLLAAPERLPAMQHSARELARSFAWERALAPAEGLYRELSAQSISA